MTDNTYYFISVTLNTLRQTNDSTVMLSWFQNMTQEGGGDCPEYAYHGLLDGKWNDLDLYW